jgi:hypothetical protein
MTYHNVWDDGNRNGDYQKEKRRLNWTEGMSDRSVTVGLNVLFEFFLKKSNALLQIEYLLFQRMNRVFEIDSCFIRYETFETGFIRETTLDHILFVLFGEVREFPFQLLFFHC